MTRKRFKGLATALMLRINNGKNDKWRRGEMLRFLRDAEHLHEYKSYQEVWDSIKDVREQYGM